MKMNAYRLYELCKNRTQHEEEEPNRFWEDSEYRRYVERHGHHFTDSLAEYASGMMENAHGEPGHHWSVTEVKDAFARIGLGKPEKSTWGDVAYSANMAYADYFGASLTTETECLKQAYADVSDPDGYEGKVFNRWLSDVMGKGTKIDWAKYA